MRDDWREARLGDVVHVNPSEPPLASDAPFVPMDAVETGARWPRYLTQRGDRAGARCRGSDTIFARITPCLENGKVAQVPASVVRAGGSTEFIVLRAGNEIDPDYLYVWATSTAVRVEATGLMTGTTGRQRLGAADLASLAVRVPPLAEQRRIVDLIGAVDVCGAAALREAVVARAALAAFLGDALSLVNGVVASLGGLFSTSIGGDWGADAGTYDRDIPVYRQTEFTDVGILNRPADAIRSLTARRASARMLRPGDILLQKSAGTPSLPGRVVRCPPDIEAATFSNFLHLLRVDGESIVPNFVFWHLWSAHQAGVALDYQAGTNIRNLNVPRYLGRKVAIPSTEVQRRIGDTADAMQAVLLRAEGVRDTVAGLRAGLLADLLSGEHAIPKAYDRFLDAAA